MSTQIYRFSVGNFDCIAIQDQDHSSTAERIFGEYPKEEWLPLVHTYQHDPTAIKISSTCLLVNTGNELVLFDGGDGVRGEEPYGSMLTNLRSANIDPADVTTVVISHGHGDHYGGMTDGNGNLTFPKARHVMWKSEWCFWTSDERMPEIEAESPERAAQIRQFLLPLRPKMELLDDESEFITGIRPIPAPGHTFAHTAFQIQSEGEHLLYIADAALHPIFFERLDWAFPNDYDKTQSGITRDKLAKLATETNALVLPYHFEFPSLGHIYRNNGVWKWQPVA